MLYTGCKIQGVKKEMLISNKSTGSHTVKFIYILVKMISTMQIMKEENKKEKR